MMNKLFVFIWMPWLLFDLGEVQPCRSSHLNGTLSGFHCPCRNNIIAEISMTERWQCFLLCMRHLDCILMEHNEDGKVCKLAKGLCYEAEGRGDVVLTALGPPRLGCVEWLLFSYITFSAVNINKTDAYFVTFLWHKFHRFWCVRKYIKQLCNKTIHTFY